MPVADKLAHMARLIPRCRGLADALGRMVPQECFQQQEGFVQQVLQGCLPLWLVQERPALFQPLS